MAQATTAEHAASEQGFPDAIGFGFAELVALLNLVRGEASTASAAALRIEAELNDDKVLFAGASSLVARGFATVEAGGELSISGPVAAVTHALSTATRRMQIDLLTADSVDNVITVDAPEYQIILQPRAYLTWFAMAQKPGLTSAEADFWIMRKHLEDNPEGGASIMCLEDPSGTQLLLKRVASSWTVGYKTASPQDIAEITELSDADVLEKIRQIRHD
ncbi:hypothetical protein [Arthrobacter cryoconiti]|uniref:Uncharacterized protein n=2 Tax=Arthrobacter cryoconiti TaxID=748907 RepID=A0ABV8QZ77_9MICC